MRLFGTRRWNRTTINSLSGYRSTIKLSRQLKLVPPRGYAPLSTDFQSVTMTTPVPVAMLGPRWGIEPHCCQRWSITNKSINHIQPWHKKQDISTNVPLSDTAVSEYYSGRQKWELLPLYLRAIMKLCAVNILWVWYLSWHLLSTIN